MDFFAERANATKAYFLYVEERRRGYAEKDAILKKGGHRYGYVT